MPARSSRTALNVLHSRCPCSRGPAKRCICSLLIGCFIHGRRRRAPLYLTACPTIPTTYDVCMKLISWNVNGIRSVHKKGALVPFLEKVKPDIACFQETKAEEHQSEVDLPDYEEYWNSSTERQ